MDVEHRSPVPAYFAKRLGKLIGPDNALSLGAARHEPIDGYRTVGQRQFCLYYNTDAARISFHRGPAFSRGADQGPWDSVVEGCREALGVLDPQVVGLPGENSCSMLGDWLASCCQQQAAAKTWSRSLG